MRFKHCWRISFSIAGRPTPARFLAACFGENAPRRARSCLLYAEHLANGTLPANPLGPSQRIEEGIRVLRAPAESVRELRGPGRGG